MKTTKITKKEEKRLLDSLKSICLIYSDFKSDKRRISFGLLMFERLSKNINLSTIYKNEIVYKAAQWGGKWGNFYKAIYFDGTNFRYGSGFSNRQILRNW